VIGRVLFFAVALESLVFVGFRTKEDRTVVRD
jgi:hypothetical protein